jgi:hypothetical protein
MKSPENEKLNHITNKFISGLSSRLIFNDENGVFVLFEEYFLEKNNSFYKVSRRSNDQIIIFSSLRVATTWVILDKYNKIVPARRVIELDNLLSGIKTEIVIHKQIKPSIEEQEIKRDKLLHDLRKQKRFQLELDKYIITAKICQERGFKNELTRTS